MSTDDFFLPVLEKHGYSGAYFCKPCSPAEQYGAPCDGCALFYRSDRFALCSQPQGKAFAISCNVPVKLYAVLAGHDVELALWIITFKLVK